MAPQTDTIAEKVITTIRELNTKYNLAIEIPDTTVAILKYVLHLYYHNVFILDKILQSFPWEALAISEDWIRPCQPYDTTAPTTTPPKAHSPGELLQLQLTLINVLKRAAETTGDTSSAVDDEVGFLQSANPFQPASAGATVSHPSKTTTCVLTPEITCATTCVPPPDTAKYNPAETPISCTQRTVPEQEHTPPSSPHSHSCDSSSRKPAARVRLSNHGHPPGHESIPGDASPSVLTTYSEVSGIDDPSLYEPILRPSQTPAPVVDLQSRLDATWRESSGSFIRPTFPPWLTRAPFAVAWEVTRIALHCGVNLDNSAMSCDRVWDEYDTMCRALRKHSSFGKKGFPERPSPEAWAAGLRGFKFVQEQHVTFAASLVQTRNIGSGPIFSLVMKPAMLDKGCRLYRHFGPDRFLSLAIPSPSSWTAPINDPDRSEEVIRWLSSCSHHLAGRQWRAFMPEMRDESNFAAACSPISWLKNNPGEPRQKLEAREMLDWLLQLDCNERQPYLKLFARIQLGLSKTTAVAVLNKDQIRHKQEDVVSPPIGQVMNDGVGRMKWDCDFLHKEHRTLEVKNPVAEPRSASLNIQFLPILENRAKDKQRMREAVGDNLLRQLSDEIEAQKNAIKHPLQFRQWVNENAHARRQRSAQGGVPFLAGLPDSEEEQLNYLVDGGFEPTKQKFMRDKMWGLRHKKCENLLKKMSIIIPNSAYLYMVVDFWGILEEIEVHVCFSSTFRTESFSDSMLHGCDVLVARSPAHLVSDIQRVKAVFKPELRALKDVIVFSAKGDVALADKLSGGDYDGDRAWVCWEPTIVSKFENANVPTRPDLSGFLRKDEASFGDLTREVGKFSTASAMITRSIAFEMQPKFLGIQATGKGSETKCSAAVRFVWENRPMNKIHGDGAQTAEYWDADLVGPYKDLEKLASTDLVVKRVLTNLRVDLETIKTKWDSSVVPVKDKSQRPGLMVEVFTEWCAIRPRADAELSPALLTWLEPSHASEEHSTWALLRASTSFKYWYQKPKLVWRMAGMQLQFIKSMARRGQVPVSVVPNMYAALKPDGTFIRQALSKMEGMEAGVGVRDDIADDEWDV
ncbi:RNA-dependent RNA polymerase [Colletotrichum camelliae]|nr:RNA-dependent RNA polymerase [Colletotrichum camelliae]